MSFPKKFEQVSLWSYQNFRHDCQIAFLSSREKFSRLLGFFLNNNFFLSLWHYEWKKDRSLAKTFRPGYQKRKSRVQQTLWGKIILLRWVQFWHLSELSTKKIFDFGRKHNNRSVEAAFAVSRTTFGRKQFFWKFCKFYEKVRTLSKKIGFQQEDWNRVVKTSFFCPGKPWRKTSSPGKIIIFFNFFGLWAQE